ncbi:hypothetical protein F4774DRAFT_149982 [Daldinia eschscholtzii]|nr:hypothetical protein F4774DRAFT_149982 [Daldinia eschscholtzii]
MSHRSFEERAEQPATENMQPTIPDDISGEYLFDTCSDAVSVLSNITASTTNANGTPRKFSFELGPDGLSVPRAVAPPVLSRNGPYGKLTRAPFSLSGRDGLADDAWSMHSLDVPHQQTLLRRRGALRRSRTTMSHMGGTEGPHDHMFPDEYTSFPFPEPYPLHSPAAEGLRNAWLGLQRPYRINGSPLARPSSPNSSVNSE